MSIFGLSKRWILVTLTALTALTGCGGGTTTGTTQASANVATGTTATGVFLDSAVQGLSYVSGTVSGVTTANGTFTYEVGKPIQFSVGGVVLGKTSGKAVITPVDLVSGGSDSNPTVVNIARFLQTIDNDANPSNGIQIPAELRTLAQSKSIDFSQSEVSFSSDGNVQVLVSELTAATTAGARALVSSNVAQAHLSSAILAQSGGSSGNGSGGVTSPSNTLTVTGPRVAGTYTVKIAPTVEGISSSLVIGLGGTSPTYWILAITVPVLGGSATSVTFTPNTISGSQFECSNDDVFGVSGDCSAVINHAATRTVTFTHAELVGPAAGDTIYVSGSLKY
jgi:hypothetical protein